MMMASQFKRELVKSDAPTAQLSICNCVVKSEASTCDSTKYLVVKSEASTNSLVPTNRPYIIDNRLNCTDVFLLLVNDNTSEKLISLLGYVYLFWKGGLYLCFIF